MSDQEVQFLRAVIHRILDDSAQPFIKRAALCARGAAFDPEILEQLRQWEIKGYLKLLCHPDRCDDNKPVVEMLSYIDQRSSIPGFLNWENT